MNPKKRPDRLIGSTIEVQMSCGKLYVTINVDEHNKPFEIFCTMGKAGGCEASQIEALGRMVSLALRCEIEMEYIIKQLINIRCNKPTQEYVSCADAIAKILKGV
jgi:ribonucleoside-diphosphate reductase alpha chain